MELSNKRCIQILHLLLNSKDRITGENLGVSIGVSSRTIRTDIKELNEFLEPYQAGVVSKIGQGYELKIQDQGRASKISYLQNRKTACGLSFQSCCFHH